MSSASNRVLVYDNPDRVRFVAGHGDPFVREPAIEAGKSTSVHYRPERYDVAAYNRANGEIRINARTVGERQLYREKFGLHLFGDARHFDARSQIKPINQWSTWTPVRAVFFGISRTAGAPGGLCGRSGPCGQGARYKV